MNVGTVAAGICLSIAVAACRQEAPAPDCTGADQWPTNMAFAKLKNAGVTNNDRLDFAKTETVRVASERLKADLFRQVHHITFVEKSGTAIEVIAVNDASSSECSMSGVDVYVVSRHFRAE